MGSGLLRYHRKQREAAANAAVQAKETERATAALTMMAETIKSEDAAQILTDIREVAKTPLDPPRRLLTRTKSVEMPAV